MRKINIRAYKNHLRKSERVRRNLMPQKKPHGVYELKQYREYTLVFRDRIHAGDILGGVPVGVVVAETLHVPFDVAVVSKITLPWNTEAGYGAVAFDGTVRLNKALMARIRLTDAEIQEGIKKNAGADHIIVAVPTAHKESLDAIVSEVDAVFCPNIRSGLRYAVADAYERWSDVDESEVLKILKRVGEASP